MKLDLAKANNRSNARACAVAGENSHEHEHSFGKLILMSLLSNVAPTECIRNLVSHILVKDHSWNRNKFENIGAL